MLKHKLALIVNTNSRFIVMPTYYFLADTKSIIQSISYHEKH